MTGLADSADRGRRVDLMGEASFPASDPPAAWTWKRATTGGRSSRPELSRSDARPKGLFKDVVIGADGTASSELALRLAARLRADDARLLALSIAEVQDAWRTGLEAGDWMTWLRAAAEKVRRSSLHELNDIPNATAAVADGRAGDVLLDAVQSRHADLLAIGAGHNSRALGLIFGSTATRLARECPCSVLVGRGDVDVDRFPRRIVVGVDGSPQSADAEAVGRLLAGSFDGQLRRLVATGGVPLDPLWIDAEIDERAPVEALTDASREADLLIVGSRGLRGVKALGSVAERLAHRAACPVLIVRVR
jgi:nucleotide-binding universal stress UspA family protein